MKREIGCDIIFLAICLSLLYVGIKTTNDLKWPYSLDHFRDIAQTQVILDGDYGKDPYYLNEYVWYNPGLHFVMSVVFQFLNIPLPELTAKLGAYLNILAPLAFYIMLRVIFGAKLALISTAAYLFILDNSYPVWASVLYSPSLHPVIFSQTLFYITIALFYREIKGDQALKQYIITGCILGVTFLFHTAPAFIGGGVILFFFLGKIVGKLKNPDLNIKELKPLLKKLLCVIIPSLFISMAFLYFIIVHYHLKIVNISPIAWKWNQLALKELPHLLQGEIFNIFGIITIYGFVHLVKNKGNKEARKIILFWFSICFGCLVIHFFTMSIKSFGIAFLLPVPAYHFFFFKSSVLCILWLRCRNYCKKSHNITGG